VVPIGATDTNTDLRAVRGPFRLSAVPRVIVRDSAPGIVTQVQSVVADADRSDLLEQLDEDIEATPVAEQESTDDAPPAPADDDSDDVESPRPTVTAVSRTRDDTEGSGSAVNPLMSHALARPCVLRYFLGRVYIPETDVLRNPAVDLLRSRTIDIGDLQTSQHDAATDADADASDTHPVEQARPPTLVPGVDWIPTVCSLRSHQRVLTTFNVARVRDTGIDDAESTAAEPSSDDIPLETVDASQCVDVLRAFSRRVGMEASACVRRYRLEGTVRLARTRVVSFVVDLNRDADEPLRVMGKGRVEITTFGNLNLQHSLDLVAKVERPVLRKELKDQPLPFCEQLICDWISDLIHAADRPPRFDAPFTTAERRELLHRFLDCLEAFEPDAAHSQDAVEASGAVCNSVVGRWPVPFRVIHDAVKQQWAIEELDISIIDALPMPRQATSVEGFDHAAFDAITLERQTTWRIPGIVSMNHHHRDEQGRQASDPAAQAEVARKCQSCFTQYELVHSDLQQCVDTRDMVSAVRCDSDLGVVANEILRSVDDATAFYAPGPDELSHVQMVGELDTSLKASFPPTATLEIDQLVSVADDDMVEPVKPRAFKFDTSIGRRRDIWDQMSMSPTELFRLETLRRVYAGWPLEVLLNQNVLEGIVPGLLVGDIDRAPSSPVEHMWNGVARRARIACEHVEREIKRTVASIVRQSNGPLIFFSRVCGTRSAFGSLEASLGIALSVHFHTQFTSVDWGNLRQLFEGFHYEFEPTLVATRVLLRIVPVAATQLPDARRLGSKTSMKPISTADAEFHYGSRFLYSERWVEVVDGPPSDRLYDHERPDHVSSSIRLKVHPQRRLMIDSVVRRPDRDFDCRLVASTLESYDAYDASLPELLVLREVQHRCRTVAQANEGLALLGSQLRIRQVCEERVHRQHPSLQARVRASDLAKNMAPSRFNTAAERVTKSIVDSVPGDENLGEGEFDGFEEVTTSSRSNYYQTDSRDTGFAVPIPGHSPTHVRYRVACLDLDFARLEQAPLEEELPLLLAAVLRTVEAFNPTLRYRYTPYFADRHRFPLSTREVAIATNESCVLPAPIHNGSRWRPEGHLLSWDDALAVREPDDISGVTGIGDGGAHQTVYNTALLAQRIVRSMDQQHQQQAPSSAAAGAEVVLAPMMLRASFGVASLATTDEISDRIESQFHRRECPETLVTSVQRHFGSLPWFPNDVVGLKHDTVEPWLVVECTSRDINFLFRLVFDGEGHLPAFDDGTLPSTFAELGAWIARSKAEPTAELMSNPSLGKQVYVFSRGSLPCDLAVGCVPIDARLRADTHAGVTSDALTGVLQSAHLAQIKSHTILTVRSIVHRLLGALANPESEKLESFHVDMKQPPTAELRNFDGITLTLYRQSSRAIDIEARRSLGVAPWLTPHGAGDANRSASLCAVEKLDQIRGVSRYAAGQTFGFEFTGTLCGLANELGEIFESSSRETAAASAARAADLRAVTPNLSAHSHPVTADLESGVSLSIEVPVAREDAHRTIVSLGHFIDSLRSPAEAVEPFQSQLDTYDTLRVSEPMRLRASDENVLRALSRSLGRAANDRGPPFVGFHSVGIFGLEDMCIPPRWSDDQLTRLPHGTSPAELLLDGLADVGELTPATQQELICGNVGATDDGTRVWTGQISSNRTIANRTLPDGMLVSIVPPSFPFLWLEHGNASTPARFKAFADTLLKTPASAIGSRRFTPWTSEAHEVPPVVAIALATEANLAELRTWTQCRAAATSTNRAGPRDLWVDETFGKFVIANFSGQTLSFLRPDLSVPCGVTLTNMAGAPLGWINHCHDARTQRLKGYVESMEQSMSRSGYYWSWISREVCEQTRVPQPLLYRNRLVAFSPSATGSPLLPVNLALRGLFRRIL
jgi:hypothetical protein